eukprot:164731-Chlamydomonas_euryale.AAC.1
MAAIEAEADDADSGRLKRGEDAMRKASVGRVWGECGEDAMRKASVGRVQGDCVASTRGARGVWGECGASVVRIRCARRVWADCVASMMDLTMSQASVGRVCRCDDD